MVLDTKEKSTGENLNREKKMSNASTYNGINTDSYNYIYLLIWSLTKLYELKLLAFS